MIVYDDVAQNDKLKIFDARVETPPHYDTFADFHYAYHYGDVYVPYIKQEEPLKIECQHFLDCITQRIRPLSGGQQGLEMVRILEASSLSLQQHGAAVAIEKSGKPALKQTNGVIVGPAPQSNGAAKVKPSAKGKKRHAL